MSPGTAAVLIEFGRHGTIGAAFVGNMDKVPKNKTACIVWDVA